MPELPEAVASGTLPQVFIHKQPEGSLVVKEILADATQAEWSSHPSGSPASLGHVYCVESSSTAPRGSCKSQTLLYPHLYSTSSTDPPVPISQHGLILVDAETHPRNVLLKFLDSK
ncbi:hypothetical protein B0H10DRAFT_2088643 [Mycena sp. CBHHK59/15]|nr:hypothetical protein B0H10DRAFT_2159430 [Mycena sp. CBHHK59/15]KAJ6596563.1 hypothetical protein B0H10DRAFT_2088643 [Mycena sp. CBHHK59/15]